MFDLLYLGTSASAPSVRRGLPSQMVIHNEFRYLIDCGEGTQRQLLTSGIGFKKLNKIFITHGHLDHILGLAGLLSTLMRWETMDEMNIYGGADAIERIHDLLYTVVLRGNKLPVPLIFHKLKPGIFIEEDDLTVSCFPVIHRGTESFGFRFDEKGRRPFLAEKAEELHIPPGPWRSALVNGENTALPDGRIIQAEDVLGEYKPGVSLAMVGDTGNADTLVGYVQGADALSIEATYLENEAELAQSFSHMTARASAQLALDAGVKSLYLTHVSRRYRERDILNEASAVFSKVVVARDLMQVTIKKETETATH